MVTQVKNTWKFYPSYQLWGHRFSVI